MEIQLKIISSLSIVKIRATRHLKAQNPNFSSNNFMGSKSGNYFLNWCNINIYWSVKIHEKSFFSSRKKFFLVHHIFMKRLTKLGLGHVKTFLRSFWAISIDIKNPYGSELWVEKYVFLTKMIVSAEYSTSVEISAWKYFFQKVWIMGYIFHISHAWKYSKPTELHYFKVTLQNTFFKGFYFKKPTARVYGYDSKHLLLFVRSRYQVCKEYSAFLRYAS